MQTRERSILDTEAAVLYELQSTNNMLAGSFHTEPAGDGSDTPASDAKPALRLVSQIVSLQTPVLSSSSTPSLENDSALAQTPDAQTGSNDGTLRQRWEGRTRTDSCVDNGKADGANIAERWKQRTQDSQQEPKTKSFVARSKKGMLGGSFGRSKAALAQSGKNFGDFTGWGMTQMNSSFRRPSSVATSERGNQRIPIQRFMLVLFLVILVGNATVQVVLRWGVDPTFHDANTEKYFPEVDPPRKTYEDIASEVIPPMKTWFRAHSSERFTFADAPTSVQECMECAEFWLRAFSDTTNITHTDPALIKMWLESLGFDQHPQFTAALGSALTEPQQIATMMQRGAECASSNPALGDGLCMLKNEPRLRFFSEWSNAELRAWLPRLVNWAYLMEALTVAAATDEVLYFNLFDYARNGVMSRALGNMEAKYEGDYLAFVKQKYTGTAQAGFVEAVKMLGNIQIQSMEEASSGLAQLQITILEAANLDRVFGLEDNTYVGVSLAAGTPFPNSMDDHRYTWMLGKHWVDAYNAWNFASVTQLETPYTMAKLLIPSVGCASHASPLGKDFIRNRVFSLMLGLLQVHLPTHFDDESVRKDWHNAGGTAVLAAVNRRKVQLNSPLPEQGERMLSQLCNGKCHGDMLSFSNSDPVAMLDDEGFRCYAGFLLWITVLIAGFGTEFFVAHALLNSGQLGDQLDERMQWLQTVWLFAQFIFSLFLTIALGSAMTGNYVGLPFLVAGLWKFGFPETYMYFFNAIVLPHGGSRSYKAGTRRMGLPLWMWSASGWSEVLNGAGTALHHGAAAGMLSMVSSGCAAPHRCIQACCLPLVLQHWFVLARYISPRLYLVLMILTEAFFEWTVFSNWECSYRFADPVRHCGAVMLVAHWIYLAASVVGMFAPDEDEEGSDDDFWDDEAQSMRALSTGASSSAMTSPTNRQRRLTIHKWTDAIRRNAKEDPLTTSRAGVGSQAASARSTWTDGGSGSGSPVAGSGVFASTVCVSPLMQEETPVSVRPAVNVFM